MATVALHVPTAESDSDDRRSTWWQWLSHLLGQSPLASERARVHGDAGRQLNALEETTLEHWYQRAEVLVALAEEPDDLTYNHVLAQPSFHVRTRYRFVGRMKPRAFPSQE